MVSSSLDSSKFPVENILSAEVDTDWLADPGFTGDQQGFIVRVSHCPSKVSGIALRNTHHGPARHHNSFATRRFRLYGSLQETGSRTLLLEQELEDSRTQIEPPIQNFFFQTTELSFLAFEMLEYWGQGGGLQYFFPITDCFGPLQPAIVSSESFDLDRFPPENILTLQNDNWLARQRTKGPVFTLKLSTCEREISGIRVKNANYKQWSTKRFRVFGAIESEGPWRRLLDKVLEDSRFQKEAPLQTFPLTQSTRLRFLKFQLVSFWGKGGGLQHFSAVLADGCKDAQGPSIVRGTSRDPVNFPATNLLTLGSDLEEDNYWLAKARRTKGQGFTMAIGECKRRVPGVALKNTHNGHNRNWATKRFRISGALEQNGPWQSLLEQYLEDSRKQHSPPLQQFFFQGPTELQFLKLELLEYWGQGGGLQYFSPLTDCEGPLNSKVVEGLSHPKFPPENVLLDQSKDEEEESGNYWLARHGKTQKQGFVMRVSICQRSIYGIKLRNTHNGKLRNRGTKRFRVSGALQEEGPYEFLLEEELEDSQEQALLPMQTFPFGETVIRFLKFELLEFWGAGGGLQYFGALSGGLDKILKRCTDKSRIDFSDDRKL